MNTDKHFRVVPEPHSHQLRSVQWFLGCTLRYLLSSALYLHLGVGDHRKLSYRTPLDQLVSKRGLSAHLISQQPPPNPTPSPSPISLSGKSVRSACFKVTEFCLALFMWTQTFQGSAHSQK